MSIERVKEFFKQHGLEDKVMEFDTSSATVELAAEAANTIPARIAKTLSFQQKNAPDGNNSEGAGFLVVAAGDARIDNAKFKSQFRTKAKMMSPEAVLELTGYAVGGVCPFAVNEQVPIYLDISLKRFSTVFPACGSSNSAIELDCDTLFKLANAREWIDVCKDWDTDLTCDAE